ADALRIRQTALDQLAELGLDPSPAVRDADVAVLRHELPGGPGIGVAPVTAAPPSRPRAAAPPGGRLPGSSAPFLGRAGDRARIAERFRGGARLVTLWGPGGVGKTRL